MANSLEQMFRQLSDEELDRAFEEFERWRTTSKLENGILLSVHSTFCQSNKFDIPVDTIREPFLFIAGQRFRARNVR